MRMRIRIRILYIHAYEYVCVWLRMCIYIYICLYICTSMYVCTLMWIHYPSWGYLVTTAMAVKPWDQHWPRFARCKAYQIGEDSADNAALARHLGLMLRISRKKTPKTGLKLAKRVGSVWVSPFLGWYNWYFTRPWGLTSLLVEAIKRWRLQRFLTCFKELKDFKDTNQTI